jgi:7-cyano-7-deazaguanine synthase
MGSSDSSTWDADRGTSPDGAARAILISGGLDSAILLAELLHGAVDGSPSGRRGAVYPLYVRSGLLWEPVELRHLHRFLDAIHRPALRPLQVLEMPVADVYGEHWSITGRGVPDAVSPDEAVFLPGRNVLLLAKALLWCHLHGVGVVALAPLEANPFPDATPAFFEAYEHLVNRAVGGSVQIIRPYAALSKVEVLRRGRGLPLELTFSCIRPVEGQHCGRCNKCGERRRAFAAAGLRDATAYAA